MFRRHRGLQLLALVEGALPRHGRSRHGDWHISLSKPSEKERHLLMTLVGEQGEWGLRGGQAESQLDSLVQGSVTPTGLGSGEKEDECTLVGREAQAHVLCVVGEGPAGGQQVWVLVCVGSRLGSEAQRLRRGPRVRSPSPSAARVC